MAYLDNGGNRTTNLKQTLSLAEFGCKISYTQVSVLQKRTDSRSFAGSYHVKDEVISRAYADRMKSEVPARR